MLSFNGWIAGISATIILISGVIIGLYCIYKSRKTHAKLLFLMGLSIVALGLIYLGLFCDFLAILLTGNNLDNTYGLVGILGYMWIPIPTICGMYIGAELMVPKIKLYVTIIYTFLAILFEVFLFLDPFGSFDFIYPETSGEDLIDDPLAYGSPVFILFFVFLLSGIVSLGFGFLIKSFQSTGLIRKKFLYLSLGFLILLIIGTLDQFPISGVILLFVRTSTIISYWLWYLGLKEVHVKEEKIILAEKAEIKKSEISLVDILSLSRPSEITAEELLYSREQLICLVCKRKIVRYTSIYACPKCKALFCENCANAIESLENACWACGEPIDKSKPVKQFKKVIKEGDVEITEKPQKEQKNDKNVS